MASPITLSGFNSIDFKAVVDLIIQSERSPIERLQARQKTEQDRATAYGGLTSSLNSLRSAFDALKTSTAYGGLKAETSDATTLSATATSSAPKGTFTVEVLALARPQITVSDDRQFADIDADIIDAGTFGITQGGVTTNIDLTGVSSLEELRDAINNQQTGVRASIINDGSSEDDPPRPFRLVLASANAGAANAFTVNDQTSFGGGAAGAVLNLGTDPVNGVAQDSELEYNGITIRNASTTVTDAVPGLTFRLFKTGTATVTVSDDNTSLKDKIKAAVNAFNSFNDFSQNQFKLAAPGTGRAPLATDSMLRGINRQIRGYLTSSHANDGDIQNLASMGIRVTQTGKLDVDESALNAALADDPAGVEAFFAGDSGFAAKISNYVDTYTSPGGAIDMVEANIKRVVDGYGRRILTMESQLALREDSLIRQFAAADQAISQLNQQASALGAFGGQFRLF